MGGSADELFESMDWSRNWSGSGCVASSFLSELRRDCDSDLMPLGLSEKELSDASRVRQQVQNGNG